MAQKSATKIVVLGDSITRGDNVKPDERFTSIVERGLSSKLGKAVTVINSGVNADITALAVHRLRRDVIDHKPDYAVMMFGVNDAGFYRPETPETPGDTPRVSADDYRSHLNSMADKISESGATVVFATPVPMSKHYWLAHLPQYVKNGLNYIVDEYAHIMRNVATARDAALIDVHRAFSARPETEDFIPDGIHPDSRGHRLIADVYLTALSDLLRR